MLGRKPANPAAAVPRQASGNLLIFGYQAWLVGFVALLGLHAFFYFVALACKGTRLDMLSRAPHLEALFLPQLICFIAAVYWGAVVWMFRGEMPTDLASVTIGDYIPQGERIGCIMLAFQLYELSACIPSGAARLRGAVNELIGHHLIVILLSYLVYHHGAFQYFAPVFMGVPEISSLPLTLVDLFKQFPELRKSCAGTNELARTLFAVTFLIFRAVYWPYCSYVFFGVSLRSLSSGALGGVAPWVVYIFLISNVLMTCLQWYWASLIITALAQMVSGDKRHKEA